VRYSRELFCCRLGPKETPSALWPEEGFAFQIHCKSQKQVRRRRGGEKRGKRQSLVPAIKVVFQEEPWLTPLQSFCVKQGPSCIGLAFFGTRGSAELFSGEQLLCCEGVLGHFKSAAGGQVWGPGGSLTSRLCLPWPPRMEREAGGERWS